MSPCQTNVSTDSLTEEPGGMLAYLDINQNQVNAKRLAMLIPKDREAWLDYLVQLLKKKVVVKYLTEKEFRKVIIRARPNLMRKVVPIVKDVPDTPECYYWTELEVACWIGHLFPHLKETFLKNCINGRRLILVDASALCKMGLHNFAEIQEVTKEIRKILGIHRCNILRAIMRRVPLELYLKRRAKSGRTYDALTFESFCKEEGFPYQVIVSNKNAVIPCTASVFITPADISTLDDDDSEISSATDSLMNAPSVEFLVRHQLVRNRAIEDLIRDMVQCVFDPKCGRADTEFSNIWSRVLEASFLELGFHDPERYSRERVEFATEVAQGLIQEMQHTLKVLQDIDLLKSYLQANVSREELDTIKTMTEAFVEEVAPLAAMLALQEFSLETVFKQEPEFQEFVEGIIDDAEDKTNELVPTAYDFVDSILSEAKLRLMARQDFPHLSLKDVASARELAKQILEHLQDNVDTLIREAYADYDDVPGDYYLTENEKIPEEPKEGLKPLMYLQGGKLMMAPDRRALGLVDREGVVRELEGGMVVARIDPKGNVIGPNNELLGKVGKKYDVLGGPTRRVRDPFGYRIGMGPIRDTFMDGHSQAMRASMRKEKEAAVLEEMTKKAINMAILEIFREQGVRTLVSSDGKNIIGVISRDGRLVDSNGATLAYTHTNGKFIDIHGLEFKIPGILLDAKYEVIGKVSEGQIKLSEAVAISKIQSEEAKRAWTALKARTSRQLLSENGNVYTIGFDGAVKNRSGTVIGSLLVDGRLLQNNKKPFPKGLYLVGSNERIIGTVEDDHLKVLRSPSIEKRVKILDTLKGPTSDEKKLVFTEDGVTFVGWLGRDGTVTNDKGEVLAQLQLDAQFLTPSLKPWGNVVILNSDRNLLARANDTGAVQLLEDSPDNFEQLKPYKVKKFMSSGPFKLMDYAGEVIGIITPNSTIISEDGRVIGKVEGARVFRNDGKAFEGLVLGSKDQVVANVQNGDLKVPRRFSMDVYTRLTEVLATPETKRLIGANGQIIAEVTPDLKLMNRGQEIARLGTDGTFLQANSEKIFNVPGVIRGVDNRVLAQLDEHGFIEVAEDTVYTKINAEEVKKLLSETKTQIYNQDQTILVGDLSENGSIFRNGVPVGKILPNGILEIFDADKRIFAQGYAILSGGKVVGCGFPNQIIKLLRRSAEVEKPDESNRSRVGDAFKLISEDGKRLLGEITPSLQLISNGAPVAEVHPQANKFVQPNDKPFLTPGILIRNDGRAVGRVTSTGEIDLGGKINLTKIRENELRRFRDVLNTGANLKLISKDGTPFGTFRPDGSLVSQNLVVGEIHEDGLLRRKNRKLFPAALVVNNAGELVGRLNEAGALRLLTMQEHDKMNLAKLHSTLKSGNKEIYTEDGSHLLGELMPDGRLVKHSVTVAELQPDGRLIPAEGEALGFINAQQDGKLIVRKVNQIVSPMMSAAAPIPPKPKKKVQILDVSSDRASVPEVETPEAAESRIFWETVKSKGQARLISKDMTDYYGDITSKGDLVNNNDEIVGRLSSNRRLVQNDGQPYRSGLLMSDEGQVFAEVAPQGQVNLLSSKSISALKTENIVNTLLAFNTVREPPNNNLSKQLFSTDGEQKIADMTPEGNLVKDGQIIAQLQPETARFVKVDGTQSDVSGILVEDGKVNELVGNVEKGKVSLVLPAVQKIKQKQIKRVMQTVTSGEAKTLVDHDGEVIGNIVGDKLVGKDGTIVGRINSKAQMVEAESGAPIHGAIVGKDNKVLGNVGKQGTIELMSHEDYEQMKADEVWDAVRIGQASRIVSADGSQLIAEITHDGILMKNQYALGKLTANGQLMLNNGATVDRGLVIRLDGVVVGSVGEKGRLLLRDINDYQALGSITSAGQILTTKKEVAGQITEDGRVFSDGKWVSYFTKDFELVSLKGLPYAKAGPNGTLYRLEVLHQPDFVPDPHKYGMFRKEPHIHRSRHHYHQHHHRHLKAGDSDYDLNPVESLLLRSADVEPHVTQRGVYNRRFKRFRTSVGNITRILTKDKIDDLRTDQMAHRTLVTPRQSFLKPKAGGMDLMNEIAEKTIREKQAEARSHHDEDAEHTRKALAIAKSVHRKELVDQWAKTLEPDGPDATSFFIPDGASEEERLRIIRITADEIVASILQMALTHVLLQAEAGVDTKQSMAALEAMKVKDGDKIDDAQTMWTPHLPSTLLIGTRDSSSGPKKYGLGMAAWRLIAQDKVLQTLGKMRPEKSKLIVQKELNVNEKKQEEQKEAEPQRDSTSSGGVPQNRRHHAPPHPRHQSFGASKHEIRKSLAQIRRNTHISGPDTDSGV